MKAKKIRKTAAILAAVLSAAFFSSLLGCAGGQREDADKQEQWRVFTAQSLPEGIAVRTVGENLLRLPGVKAKADSRENADFGASAAIDGICEDRNLRWSSENNWEDPEHWLQVAFPQETAVGAVRIFWERDNALRYALEYSTDGKSWTQAAAFETPPEDVVQDIVLEAPVTARYLRLHVTDVRKEEADLSLYYQNISVLELEAYAGIEDDFLIEKPVVSAGSRRRFADETKTAEAIPWPTVPTGYTLEFVGADYEELVDRQGRIADVETDVQVELGFALKKGETRAELPGMEVTIPAGREAETGSAYRLGESVRVLLEKDADEAFLATAQLFSEELSEVTGRNVPVATADPDAEAPVREGDIFLERAKEPEKEAEAGWPDGLGEEGYRLCLYGPKNGGTRIVANTSRGLRWGCVALMDLLEEGQGSLTEGTVSERPRYSVRGFGIDVGRRAVPLEFLYRVTEEMSRQKMNTLLVHLNDNQIISSSGYDGTLEGAYGLYAGFRLESDLQNEDGEGITSGDLFYTKEEFARFIADAAAYGVEVVPEIDTPAHCLALTKVFPQLGLAKDPEGADQLDLSRPAAVQLGKDLWSEYLTAQDGGQEAVFARCGTVHIGMDEYFGDSGAWLSYLKALTEHIGQLAPEKKIRLWGSFTGMGIDPGEIPADLQVQIWDTGWADPADTYGAGLSIVNSLSSSLYIIPGGGYDWLDFDFLEEKWQPNVFETPERTWTLPAYSDRMLGACYMLWNDWQQAEGKEISLDGLFARFAQPLPVIAQKLWGRE